MSSNDEMTMRKMTQNDRMSLNDEMSLNDRMTQWPRSVRLEIRFMTLNNFTWMNLPIVTLGSPYSFYSAGVSKPTAIIRSTNSYYHRQKFAHDPLLHLVFYHSPTGRIHYSISLVSIDSGIREDFSIHRPRMGRKGRHHLSILRLATLRGPRHDRGLLDCH